ncbi:endonuclease VII domain-containing protein [Patescibacteria group bacterium]|nr:endonuclease VII domain-containing protein [Patescibacteria group bacterium]
MYKTIRLTRYGRERDYFIVPCDTCAKEFPKRGSFVQPEKHNFCTPKCRDEFSELIHKLINQNEKVCRKCKISKTLDNFYKRSRSKDGLTSWCKTCTLEQHKTEPYKNTREKHRENCKEHITLQQRATGYLRRYNLTWPEFTQLQNNQNGTCAICGKIFSPQTWDKRTDICIDHDHQTGKVRGLLCHLCNRGLGQFYDRVDLLEQAIKYLNGDLDDFIEARKLLEK